jgi:hypothetical protein
VVGRGAASVPGAGAQGCSRPKNPRLLACVSLSSSCVVTYSLSPFRISPVSLLLLFGILFVYTHIYVCVRRLMHMLTSIITLLRYVVHARKPEE